MAALRQCDRGHRSALVRSGARRGRLVAWLTATVQNQKPWLPPRSGGVAMPLSIVDAEPPVPCVFQEPRKLRLVHTDQGGVIAALEINLRLLLNAVVDDHIQPV